VNIKEYIASGIIESYVLGLASDQERAEFEQLVIQYPELAEARLRFESELEKQAFASAINPPGNVKEKILNIIGETGTSLYQPKTVSKENTGTPVRNQVWLRFAAAACLILFIVSGYFAYKFYNQNKELTTKNIELEKERDSVVNIASEQQKVMNDPNVTVVNMVGTQKAPTSSANVYWDSTSNNVWLVVKNMPKLASDKQYQLWALIDGKPVDLGLFDPPDNKVILKMNNTQKADAFAITIETKGNTGGPTLEELQSMGKARLQ